MPDSSTQLEMFPTCLHLQRVDPARNMRRFYRITTQDDLFGEVSLLRIWGRIGTQGRQLIDTYADEGSAINALIKLADEKRRRGYNP